MSFPHHDPAWTDAADFVRAHRRAGDAVLAPDAFVWRFDRIYRYANTAREPARQYDWALIHSWMMQELALPFLRRVEREMRPVHANAAFVIWARDPSLPRLGRFHPRLAEQRRHVRALARQDGSYPGGGARQAIEPVLPDPGILSRFALLSVPELKQAMDLFFGRGGYVEATRRDRGYTAAMDRRIREMVGDTSELRVLDLCAGDVRLGAVLGPCRAFVNVDLSEVGLKSGARRFAHRADFAAAVMDAQELALPDASFDVVICIDSIEHIHDAGRMVAEAARVLAPGGRLVLSTQNRDSLHLVMTRKLGYPEFLTSYQHMREFGYRELCDLVAAKGLAVEQAEGIGLYPYWGIPGIDRTVRHLIDDDPEVVDLLFGLGDKAGPEHSYSVIVKAVKPAVVPAPGENVASHPPLCLQPAHAGPRS